MKKRHEMWELQQMQALPLKMKIKLTQSRIRQWVNEFGEDGVYISFSGGKDSTVLLDIIRKMYPSIKAVYVDTGLEYPEIKHFIKGFDNVEIIRPEMVFKDVITKHGYPMISKEVSECVQGARKYLTSILQSEGSTMELKRSEQKCIYCENTRESIQTDSIAIPTFMKSSRDKGNTQKEIIPSVDEKSFKKMSRGDTTTSIENYEELANILNERMLTRQGGSNRRLAIMLGWLTKDKANPIKANIPSQDRSNFSQEKYKFFLNAPFEISNKCCNVMKKKPAHTYGRKSGKKPITAQMASESRLRTQKWLQNGCNAFDAKNPISNPMSFWTEQDVLLYIKEKDLIVANVYGKIIEDNFGTGEVQGQLTMSDIEGWEKMSLFDAKRLPLKTTGCTRTGCMFCGFGCHLEKSPNRFERMAETHSKLLDYVMRGGAFDKDDGLWKPDSKGLGYWFVLQWINVHGNFNIAIPNYEQYEKEYGTELTREYLKKE